MTENISRSFPPVTYSTAYEYREKILQFLEDEGILLPKIRSQVYIAKQKPADSSLLPFGGDGDDGDGSCNGNGNGNGNDNDNGVVKKCRKDEEHALLKFLALNALDLTAPACGRLLHHRPYAATAAASDGDGDGDGRRRETPQTTGKPAGSQSPSWCQLSGHPDCFSRAGPGTIWKKCSGGTERNVYEALSAEPHLRHVVPRFLREVEYKGEKYIELQDLLHSFRDPYVMDIKMGARTFLESEVQNTFAREDLYLKMIAVDANAPTDEENASRKVTKLRYMQFREEQSSTSTLGFRIEAMKFRGSKPVTDLKKVKSKKEVADTLSLFLGAKENIRQRLVSRLVEIRTTLEQSQYFKTHEIVGSSILIIYDDVKVGAWMIDFAKTRPVPPNVLLTHRLPWSPGNHEDGFLFGLDHLVNILENLRLSHAVVAESTTPSILLKS